MSLNAGHSRVCPHEREVLDLVAMEQWPQRADAALRAHVDACESCAEVASVASAVREWGESAPPARMPESSIVWHRAQLRAKAEAARSAARPVWAAQIFALVVLVAALVWIGPSADWYSSAWQRLTSAVPASSVTLAQPAGQPGTITGPGLSASWGGWVGLGLAGVGLFVSLVIGAVRLSERLETSK
jgi:hypothetical protein